MIKILTLLFICYSFAYGKKLTINNYTIDVLRIEKKGNSDFVQLKKGSRLLSQTRLEREGTLPKVLNIKHINNQQFFVNYSKGFLGTSTLKRCSELYLFSITQNKLKLLDKKIYECDINSKRKEDEELGFSFYYSFKNNKIKLSELPAQ